MGSAPSTIGAGLFSLRIPFIVCWSIAGVDVLELGWLGVSEGITGDGADRLILVLERRSGREKLNDGRGR